MTPGAVKLRESLQQSWRIYQSLSFPFYIFIEPCAWKKLQGGPLVTAKSAGRNGRQDCQSQSIVAPAPLGSGDVMAYASADPLSAGSSPTGSALLREGERRQHARLGPCPPPADAPAGRSARRIVPTSSPESGGRAFRPILVGNSRKSLHGRDGGNAEGDLGRARLAWFHFRPVDRTPRVLPLRSKRSSTRTGWAPLFYNPPTGSAS